MKKLLILLLLVVVAVPIGVGMFGGQLLGKGVEKGGTMALGTPTTVGGASLNVLSGNVGLKDLQVKNPAGFEADHAFKVGSIDVQTDLGSLTSDTIVIDEILIASPVITVEINQNGTNLGALMDRLGKAEEPSTPTEPKEGGKKMKIGKLVIEAAEVNLVQSLLLKKPATLTLPTLTMENVGEDVSMAELIEKVLGLIMTAVSEAQVDGQLKGLLKGKIPGDLKKQLDGAVGDLTKQLKGLGDNLPEGLGESADKLADELNKGLGGLLGGDK